MSATSAVVNSYAAAEIRAAEINRALGAADRLDWCGVPAERKVARRLLEEFGATAAGLESCGWSAGRIQETLEPSRQVFATSEFMRRCQQWRRGYPGDFDTIEHLAVGSNLSVTGTFGWLLEDVLLQSPVVQQHRNKLTCQSLEIERTVRGNRAARVLSMACGGCLDWAPVLPHLKDFDGEIILNDGIRSIWSRVYGRFQTGTAEHPHRPRVMVRPDRADSRAASRISITITLFSSDDRPDGLNLPRATPIKYEMESASCGCNSGGVARFLGLRARQAHAQVVAAGGDGVAASRRRPRNPCGSPASSTTPE